MRNYKINKIVLTLCFMFSSSLGLAANPQDWVKQLGKKSKKISSKQTTVAAIRGVEELSDVDQNARNFEALAQIEKRKVPEQTLNQFITEGNLKNPVKEPETQTKIAPPLSETIPNPMTQAPVSKELKEAARPLSLEEEIALGREVAANVIAQFGLYENESLTQYVNLVGMTLVENSSRKDIEYHFAILNSPVLNAFAAPGGYIFITKGLLSLLKDESQLAAILGHEVAHVTQKHVIKEIQKSKMVEAVIPSHIKAAANQAPWMKQISGLAIQTLWKGLSREDELESDRFGLEFAAKAGYDPQSFSQVLQMLKNRSLQSGKSKELRFLLSTHPQPEDRLRLVEEKLKSYPQGGEKLDKRFNEQTKL
ncbi:MAG: M48 family metalloprotease [Elusimicrobia bacterium]|nr:M48 family metalloprotease [Elusimicrobiota bacterium]